MYTEEFGCCLERTLRTVDTIQSISHLYNTTKQCNTYLVTPLNDSLFITAVVHFYLREMENTTLVCKQEICEEKTSKYYIAYVSFWIIALIVGVIGNILVCVAFYQSAILRKAITNFFVTSLAISDLLVVVFIIPLKIHYALHNQEFCAPPIFCRLFYTTDTTFFAASITNIFIISVDRYVAVVRPYNYRDILTPKRGKTLIVCIWIYSAIWGLMVHFNPNTNNFDAIFLQNYTCSTNNQLYYRIQYVMVFYIPSIIMFIIYIKILRISRSHARHIDARRNNLVTLKIQKKYVCTLFHQPSYFANHKHELRATKVVVVVYGTFLLCWFPIIFTSTFHYLLSPSLHSKLLYSIIAEILPFTNSLFNPFIYGILHRDFKRSLKRIFAKIILEYQMIGTVRRSSQSTKSYEISSNESTPNTNDVMEDCKLKQNKDEALLPMASKKSNAI